jgi:hypothetical protein
MKRTLLIVVVFSLVSCMLLAALDKADTETFFKSIDFAKLESVKIVNYLTGNTINTLQSEGLEKSLSNTSLMFKRAGSYSLLLPYASIVDFFLEGTSILYIDIR